MACSVSPYFESYGDWGSDTWLTGNTTVSFYYNNASSLTQLNKSVITYNDSFNHTPYARIIYESITSTLCGGHICPSLTQYDLLNRWTDFLNSFSSLSVMAVRQTDFHTEP